MPHLLKPDILGQTIRVSYPTVMAYIGKWPFLAVKIERGWWVLDQLSAVFLVLHRLGSLGQPYDDSLRAIGQLISDDPATSLLGKTDGWVSYHAGAKEARYFSEQPAIHGGGVVQQHPEGMIAGGGALVVFPIEVNTEGLGDGGIGSYSYILPCTDELRETVLDRFHTGLQEAIQP